MKKFLKILAVLALILGAAFLIFRTPDTDAADIRAKYGGGPSQFVTLSNGQEIHLRDEGPKDAPAIILLHGANSSLHTWDKWTAALSQNYRVIRYDQIGHGLTGPAADGNYSRDAYVGDVKAIADHLELETFVLAGNSMGGWVTAAFALEHPDRLAGIALLNASGAPRNKEEEKLYLGAVIASIPVLNNVMTQITPRSLVESSLEDAVADPAFITEEMVDRYWELLRYPGNRQAVVDRANTPRGGHFDPADIAGLTMPTIIIWGKEDRVTPPSGARWYDQNLPDSTLIEYAGIGHLPMEEAPEKSAADFKKWLVNGPFKVEAP